MLDCFDKTVFFVSIKEDPVKKKRQSKPRAKRSKVPKEVKTDVEKIDFVKAMAEYDKTHPTQPLTEQEKEIAKKYGLE